MFVTFVIGFLMKFLYMSDSTFTSTCFHRVQTAHSDGGRFDYPAPEPGGDCGWTGVGRRCIGLRAERSPHPSWRGRPRQVILLSGSGPVSFERPRAPRLQSPRSANSREVAVEARIAAPPGGREEWDQVTRSGPVRTSPQAQAELYLFFNSGANIGGIANSTH